MKNITNFDLNLLQSFENIYVLVSGGIDSTYLWELISEKYPTKTKMVNCFNPYETSATLKQLQQDPRFILILPGKEIDYGQILRDSFRLIPKAINARKHHKYEKKIFPCCKKIKHEAFLHDPLFQQPNTVVISGIKAGDGKIRRFFLKDLRNGNQANYSEPMERGFFHRHKEGQLYCYPFRDYNQRELPKEVIFELKQKYITLDHSSCSICPIVVVFKDKFKNNPHLKPSLEMYYKICNQTKLIL